MRINVRHLWPFQRLKNFFQCMPSVSALWIYDFKSITFTGSTIPFAFWLRGIKCILSTLYCNCYKLFWGELVLSKIPIIRESWQDCRRSDFLDIWIDTDYCWCTCMYVCTRECMYNYMFICIYLFMYLDFKKRLLKIPQKLWLLIVYSNSCL